MTEFIAKKVNCALPVHINAPVEKVFPLCCPVEEYRWIPGWKCDLIYCPNDKVELGTVFSEISSAPFLLNSFKGKTTWTAVMHDPDNYKLHFRLDNKISSSLYKIELRNNSKGGTIGNLDFTYNAINKKGNKLAEKHVEDKIRIMLTIITAMLQHYCEIGEMLNFASIQKVVMSDHGLSIIDKINMGLNRMVMSKMKDKERGRFMRKFYGDGRKLYTISS